MMMNWEDAENAYKEAMNSAGSAVKENEAFLNSIEGRKQLFKSAFESLSNNLLNGDLVKTGISAGTQIVKGLNFAVKHTGGGGILLGGGLLLKSLSKSLPRMLMTDSLTEAFKDIWSVSQTSGVTSTISGMLRLLTPMQATLGAIGVAAAAVGVAYKVWDVNTIQLSEAQEKLNDSLSNVSSAQQHIASIEEEISANEEKISQIRKSGVTTIAQSAELSNLQRQNELLKVQKQYQQTISNTESLKAASSARVALGISSGYAASGSSTDGLYKDAKVGKFMQFMRTVFNTRDSDITDTEYAIRTAEDYLVAQQRLNDAMNGQFVSKDLFGSKNDKEYDRELEKYGTIQSFKTQQDAVDFWQTQVSELESAYSTNLQQQYQYLEAFTDQSTGGALKGYEKEFRQVRNTINALNYKNSASDESFLNYLLGSSADYEKVSDELANLSLNDGFVKGWEDSSKAIRQFVDEANSAGMTDAATKIERIWKTMASGTPNSALALVEDNFESLSLSMQEYETRVGSVLKAAKTGFGVGGLDVESRNTLAGSYQEAMMDTQNGVRLDYRLFDEARARNASKEIGANTSEIRTQQKLLATLQSNYEGIESKIESYSGRYLSSGQAAILDEYKARADELKQEMSVVRSNISNLKTARSELNGLNSEVYQYMSAADGSYNQSAVADSMGDSFKALKEAADTGKKTSASAREFMNLWTNQDLTGMKNSEIAAQWDTAFANMEKYYDAQYNSQGNLEKYVLNEGKIISEINKAGDVMDKTFITAGKDIEMTSSHVLNLAKVMGISESAVTEMVNALADYGYNVSFIDTAEDIESIAAKADPSKTVEYLERYNEEIIKLRANGISSNQTKFGNIDLNNRQAIHWTEEELQKQQASSEYGVQVGDVSTVLGSWDKFGEAEIPIAYSPILQTENGAKLLSQNTVSEYLWGIIDKATESGVELNKENLLKLDTEGLEFDGLQIKNLIADIGDTAEKTAQSMHSLGENGALDLNVKALDSYIDDIQEARDATESGAELDALNAEMTKALFVRKQITRSSETNGVLGIDTEKEVGAVQDGVKTLQDLQEAYESYEVAKEARSKYSIDAKLEEEEGLYEASLSRLSDYVKEQNLEAKIGLDSDASAEEIGEKLKQLLSEGGVGEINGKLDISNVDVVGGEVAQEKASEVAQSIAEAINTTLTESKSALDSYLGEGNYQVELDAQGNIVSVTVSDTAEIPEVTLKGEVTDVDEPKGVRTVNVTDNQITTNITATTSGKEEVDDLKTSMDGVTAKAVLVKASTMGQSDVDTLRSSINNTNSKSVSVSATTSGVGEVMSLSGAIAGIHSKSVSINVSASVSGVAQSLLSGAGRIGLNGTAHFGGTAYSTGNWGVSKNETALLGEVGSELVVNPKTGTWHTVDKASFERLPKGSIVFNHKQTEELFKNGYVTSGGGHGRVVGSLLNGTAHASGTALAEGSENSSNNEIDFIAIRLKRLADVLDRLTNTAELYENFEEKNLEIQKAVAKAYEGVSENLSAYNAYISKANSIGLDESYASKVRNGSINIEDIGDENLKTKITDYQKWYDAAEAVQDTIISLKKQVKELAKQRFDNITKSYDSFLSLVNAIHDKYSAMNDLFEETEGRQSINYLQEMGGQNNSEIARLRGQISELLTELYAQESTSAPRWSEAWVEAQAKINETQKALYEARLELQEVNNEIRKTNWVDYNNLTAQLEAYGDEVDTVYSLIGDLNSFESANAAITQNGISKLGALTSSLKNARQQVANYTTAYEALNKELALGVINEQEYQDELLDLQKSQRDAAESVKKYKDEIIGLIKDGINAETEAFQELIEARRKDLSKQKEADDYAKNIADKTKEINRVRAQVAALSGDDSQATKARIKSLQADLLKMEEDLAETRRDHEYNTMVEAYDDELEHFGEIQDDKIEALTESLAKQNEAISSALTLARDNYSTIYNQLNDLVEEYGVSLSSNLVDPWTEATEAINEYKAALQRATSNASISSDGYVSETDDQAITHYGNSGVGRGNYKSLYDGTAIMDGAHIHGKVLGFVPKGAIAESDGAVHDGWIHIKYNGIWGWTSIGNVKRAARGTFNASGGLTLTDEYGLGSEAIITKQGVLRQLNSGDMVFNASQKNMLWKLSKLDVPAMIGNLGASVGVLSRLGGDNNSGTNISMNYGSLLTVNGNVDRDALPNLEDICKAASDYIKKDITSTFRKIGIK